MLGSSSLRSAPGRPTVDGVVAALVALLASRDRRGVTRVATALAARIVVLIPIVVVVALRHDLAPTFSALAAGRRRRLAFRKSDAGMVSAGLADVWRNDRRLERSAPSRVRDAVKVAADTGDVEHIEARPTEGAIGRPAVR
jgi:hypothetical protein